MGFSNLSTVHCLSPFTPSSICPGPPSAKAIARHRSVPPNVDLTSFSMLSYVPSNAVCCVPLFKHCLPCTLPAGLPTLRNQLQQHTQLSQYRVSPAGGSMGAGAGSTCCRAGQGAGGWYGSAAGTAGIRRWRLLVKGCAHAGINQKRVYCGPACMHVKVASSVGDTLLAASCFGCMLVLFVLTHIEGGTACFYVSTFLYLPGSGQHA